MTPRPPGRAGKPLKSGMHPHLHPTPAPSAAPTIPQEVSFERRRRRFDLRLLLLLLVVPVAYWLLQPGPPDQGKLALADLKEIQLEWWRSEQLQRGAEDPEVAFQNLLERQRHWWNAQRIGKEGSLDGTIPLADLEKRQREWWQKEQLGDGKPIADPSAVLKQLEQINRNWWQGQQLAVLPESPPASTSARTEVEELASDPVVELAPNRSLKNFFEAGGTQTSEEAVSLGLQWLASQQRPDGSWSLNGKAGKAANPNAATAFALLPFLARGETHKTFNENVRYTKVVERGIFYLVKQQKPDGDLRGGARMYTHAVATLALCEAFNMTSDPVLREPCQKAIDFIITAQDPRGGGWRYSPRQAGDTSVTSWQIQALKSGFLGGLHVPRETWQRAGKFLASVAMPNNNGYGYTRGVSGHRHPKPASMTACGLLCQQYIHGNENSLAPTHGIDLISASPPAAELKNIYYYYYATQVVFNLRDDPKHKQRWEAWNPSMRALLLGWQDRSEREELRGSWPPMMINTNGYGGRLVTTSMALLTLEVYYRHLPLNRPSLGDAAKRLEK